MVLLTPLVVAVFSWLAARGREPSTPAKIALGLFITGLSTLVMILAVSFSDNGANKVSPMWLVATYAVITVGELCLSPMGLSLVSKLSPARLTVLMMGGWFLSTSIGNKLAGVLGHLGADSENKSFVFIVNFTGAILGLIIVDNGSMHPRSHDCKNRSSLKMHYPTTVEEIQNFSGKYPRQLWYLFLVEMWGRFTFYGMRPAGVVHRSFDSFD